MENKIICGDALTKLKELPKESVDMCMTSPPYWALRDYGVDGQLGLEPTFDQYINKLCDIFDGVKRVLKKEGTCWVNISDTYGGSGNSSGHTVSTKNCGKKTSDYGVSKGNQKATKNLQKSLLCIPFRFAIEMVNRGWILRNTIIWHKPNCMPSSAKDRFTVDFEYLFMFSKKKKYYFDQQFEDNVDPNRTNYAPGKSAYSNNIYGPNDSRRHRNTGFKSYAEGKICIGRNKRTVWKITTKGFPEAHFAVYPEELCETPIKAGCPKGGIVLDPFFGAGTTGLVALKQGKKFIGIELNPEYIKIADKRLKPYLNQWRLGEF